MQTETEAFVRTIEFAAAFDKRHPDPKKNYGIHGVEMRFILCGSKGAVQFLLYTDWQLPHVRNEQKARHGEHGLYWASPMPADIGYHSPVPLYDEQKALTDECPHIGGRPCYYDGSSLMSEKVWDVLIWGGEEAVWIYLEDWYTHWFADSPFEGDVRIARGT